MKVFWKFNFSHKCTLIVGIFDNLNRNFDKRPKIVAQCPKLTKNHSFFNNFFSSNWSYGHVERCFGSPTQFLTRKPQISGSRWVIDKNCTFYFFPFWSFSHGQVKNNFNNQLTFLDEKNQKECSMSESE